MLPMLDEAEVSLSLSKTLLNNQPSAFDVYAPTRTCNHMILDLSDHLFSKSYKPQLGVPGFKKVQHAWFWVNT